MKKGRRTSRLDVENNYLTGYATKLLSFAKLPDIKNVCAVRYLFVSLSIIRTPFDGIYICTVLLSSQLNLILTVPFLSIFQIILSHVAGQRANLPLAASAPLQLPLRGVSPKTRFACK
jgi:hypothetical protein